MALIRLSNQSLTDVTALPAAALPEVGFKRVYTGKNTNGVPFSTTPVTLVSIPNVVVNSGEDVFLAYHISVRAQSAAQVHCSVIPHYSGSATGYVGDSNWGIGIHDPSTPDAWTMMNGFVNLSKYRTGGGGPFASTGTFTFDIKSRSTNVANLWGSEYGGTQVSYTPLIASILIAKA